jgi:site-specific DNA recombinase
MKNLLSTEKPRKICERRVLVGLTDKLVSPEAVAVAVRAYAEETNRHRRERRAEAETSCRALEKIERHQRDSRSD